MNTKLTAILWCSHGSLAETPLFGRPLWHWTLQSVRNLRPERILLLKADAAHATDGVEKVTPRRLYDGLGRLYDKVLLVPAELPCIQPATLKRLVSASRSRSRYLITDQGPQPRAAAVCMRGRDLKPLCSRLASDGLDSLVERLQPLPVAASHPDELLEVRNLTDWSRAARILRRRKCEKLLASGVLIDNPDTVHVDPDVRVGRGTRIHGWVVIEGETQIGTHCEIGSFTHLIDSVVGKETVLFDHCFIRSSRIGKNAQLGPFAHLRPDSVIGAKAKVGNFVELKKTTLGRGSKAPHLSYLGDAEIGSGVNVGAGTITCNYDGESKYLTVIGDGAFIGSDVQLVAPVRVGRGAYVAAGSCIVEDVPPESLALARSRQVVKPGWARRKRKKR